MDKWDKRKAILIDAAIFGGVIGLLLTVPMIVLMEML